MRLCYLFLLYIFVSTHSFGSQESGERKSTPAEDSSDNKKNHFGTWWYSCPTNVEYHLEKIAKDLGQSCYWLFEYSWTVMSKQETLRQLSPLDEEYGTLKQEIIDEVQNLKRLSNGHYKSMLKNILEYVEPNHLPKHLSWRLGILTAHYGNFLKESALLNPNHLENVHLMGEENSGILNFYKISLLFFSYYFGFTDCSPAIIQYATLDEILSHPEFFTKIDRDFENAWDPFDEKAWIEAMNSLDQQSLEHLCGFFRSIYSYLLQQQEPLSQFYIDLATHLCRLTTQLILSSQNNPVYNLDAVNPWMFKLYIDLNKWEKESLFLPELEKQCLKLLPRGFTLNEVNEENEYTICNEVRMRNLLPTNQEIVKKGEEIFDEFEFSPIAMRQAFLGLLQFFDDRADYLMGYQTEIKESNDRIQQIYNYLSGYVEMHDVPITKDNALDYLFVIKLFDLLIEVWNANFHVKYDYAGIHFGYIGFGQYYFPRTTYELRKKILKLCPTLKSYEALTLSVNPQKLKDEKEQTTPGAWIEESEALRNMCIAELLQNAHTLIDLMEQSPLKGVIVGSRGISGAGKSTFLKKAILPLIIPESENETIKIESLSKGILNPDIIKAVLKSLQGDTLNSQIHHEGSHAFQQIFQEVSERGNYILDKRHLTPHGIVTDLVLPAKKNNSSVWLFDFDISLTTSLLRVLARPLYGEEPCPEYEALIDGYRSIRRHRAQVLKLVMQETTISKYELYATSKQKLIAHKKEGPCPLSDGSFESLCIHDLQLFDACLKEPTDQEIENELSQVITDSFIAEAINRGDISFEQQEMAAKWRGLTLKASIQRHVQGSKGEREESLFEHPSIFPFNGVEWLSDLPHVIEFLRCEHLLHIYGVDEAGRGLHWEEGQNEKEVNPKYNSNAKVSGSSDKGIQMKVGYFIVPKDKLDLYFSKNLSPAVSKELAVRDVEGQLIGLRFFVHPEAYMHYASLLRAGISFVPPSHSEFMGTPLSSYHSWLIRNVSLNDRRPFIVKMGTPNGCSDIKHLFAGDEIVRSIWLQKRLDQIPNKPDFTLFNETAGIILENIPGYPEGTIDSGIIICELPDDFLKGDCKFFSFSSLMSCERIKPENRAIAPLNSTQHELDVLPLIFELIDISIQKGIVKTSEEFIKTYFIDGYFQAIESLVFKEGLSLVGESDNFYLVLNTDNTVRGFSYRDLEGVISEKNFLQSYSWFYRYANFIKLLNVLTQSDSEDLPPPLGGPIRPGIEKQLPERSLNCTLKWMLEKEGDASSLKTLKKLSIPHEESLHLLKQLDAHYLNLLKRYFTFDEAVILNSDGTIPSAEKGAMAEKDLFLKNQILWEGRLAEE